MPKIRSAPKCTSLTKHNVRCKNKSVHDSEFCAVHKPADCSICLDVLNYHPTAQRFKLHCNHAYHKECIATWIEHADHYTCPLCRTELNAFEVYHLYDGYVDDVVCQTLMYPEIFINIHVKKFHVRIPIEAGTGEHQISLLTGMIESVQAAKLAAEEEDRNRTEPTDRRSYYEQRVIVLCVSPTSERYLGFKLPRTPSQMHDINVIMDAIVLTYDVVMENVKAARQYTQEIIISHGRNLSSSTFE